MYSLTASNRTIYLILLLLNGYYASFQQRAHLEVAMKSPVLISSPESRNKYDPAAWVTSHAEYLAIHVVTGVHLISSLGRSNVCILLPRSTNYQARHDAMTKHRDEPYALVVGLGFADLEEARWWAAVPAQSQGGRATMQHPFCSRWSIRLEPKTEHSLSTQVSAFTTSSIKVMLGG
jgi:hypothetical protein